jgi:hypothetical protein
MSSDTNWEYKDVHLSAYSSSYHTWIAVNRIHALFHLVVLFLVGECPASEFDVPTFRNTVCSIYMGDVNSVTVCVKGHGTEWLVVPKSCVIS